MPDAAPRSGRDTRLLGLVIVISIAVLLVLARFRFPGPDAVPPAAPGPLERLAARATFEDLSAAVQAALQSASSSVVLVDLEPEPAAPSAPPRPLEAQEALVPVALRRVAGIRVRDDQVAAVVPPAYRPVGGTDAAPGGSVRVDLVRGVAVWSLTAAGAGERAASLATDFRGFAYVAVVEAATGGPTVTPAFIGRIDPVFDERWGGWVWLVGGSAAPQVGALVFLLDGRFLGLVVDHAGGVRALIPAALVAQAVDTLGGPAEASR